MSANPVLKFESARLKVERANHHIRDLKTEFSRFIRRDPYQLIAENNTDSGQPTVQIKFNERIPNSISLIVGDAIHNLRTALDHMTWEVIGHDGGEQDRWTKLPIGDNRVNFESTCQGIKTPSQAVKDLFKELEVFPSGKGGMLYSLHLLNNADKHHVITPVLGITQACFRIIYPNGNIQAGRAAIIGANKKAVTIDSFSADCRIELYENAKATPDIFFDNVQAFYMKPIFPTLRQLSNAVTDTLDIVAGSVS